MKKIVYSAAAVASVTLVSWPALHLAEQLGPFARYPVSAAVVGVIVLAVTALRYAFRDAADKVAEIVARELDKRESPVESLLDAVKTVPDGFETLMADGKPVARVARHRLLDPEETQELFTHNYRALAAYSRDEPVSDPCQLPVPERPHVQSVENYMRSAPAPWSTIPELDDELNGRKHEGDE